MKKEVLKIEYDKAFDIWFGKIVYQDEEVLKRQNFGDEAIGVYSAMEPCFSRKFKTLFLRGEYKNEDNKAFYIGTDKDKKIIEEKVRKINEKYGVIRKSWKEMVDECERVVFVAGEQNWEVFYNHREKAVNFGWTTYVEGIKHISKEDAERIVKECKENNEEE